MRKRRSEWRRNRRCTHIYRENIIYTLYHMKLRERGKKQHQNKQKYITSTIQMRAITRIHSHTHTAEIDRQCETFEQ